MIIRHSLIIFCLLSLTMVSACDLKQRDTLEDHYRWDRNSYKLYRFSPLKEQIMHARRTTLEAVYNDWNRYKVPYDFKPWNTHTSLVPEPTRSPSELSTLLNTICDEACLKQKSVMGCAATTLQAYLTDYIRERCLYLLKEAQERNFLCVRYGVPPVDELVKAVVVEYIEKSTTLGSYTRKTHTVTLNMACYELEPLRITIDHELNHALQHACAHVWNKLCKLRNIEYTCDLIPLGIASRPLGDISVILQGCLASPYAATFLEHDADFAAQQRMLTVAQYREIFKELQSIPERPQLTDVARKKKFSYSPDLYVVGDKNKDDDSYILYPGPVELLKELRPTLWKEFLTGTEGQACIKKMNRSYLQHADSPYLVSFKTSPSLTTLFMLMHIQPHTCEKRRYIGTFSEQEYAKERIAYLVQQLNNVLPIATTTAQ